MKYTVGSRLNFINGTLEYSELLAAHLTSLITPVEHTAMLAVELIFNGILQNTLHCWEQA
jgi:hypothetical protein